VLSSAPNDGPRRAHLIDLLERVHPVDSEEVAHLDFAKDWVSSGAVLYRMRKPDVPKVHLVSYFVIVDPRQGKLLLVDHRKAKLWLPPGGHVEPDDADPWATVQRECPEELFIEAQPMEATKTVPFFATVTQTRGAGTHTDVSLWYVVQADAGDITDYDGQEFAEIRWMTPQQVLNAQPEILDPHLPRAVGKLAQVLGPAVAG
jgi:8-oxo-dGTP pyrophosphatase MutT (NUDIX family)